MPAAEDYFKCNFKFSGVISCHEVPVALGLFGFMVLWSLAVPTFKEGSSTRTNTLGHWRFFILGSGIGTVCKYSNH
jgi:hypothetical protein